jgi:hypothetical protein
VLNLTGKVIILKRLLSLVLAIVMIFTVASFSVYAENTTLTATQKNILKMQRLDADKDGTYTTGDVSSVLEAAAGITQDGDSEDYDINGDGYISLRDAMVTLDAVTEVAPVVTQEELLAIFNERINSVKKNLPGFTRREILTHSSVTVTTVNPPNDAFKANNLEYPEYVNQIDKLMHTWPYSMALSPEMEATLKEMKTYGENLYKPRSQSVAVGKGTEYEDEHIALFAVGGLSWSSNLTINDIKSISYTMTGGRIYITITMKDYSYAGDAYPTGATGLNGRAKLPYGKAFNLPDFDESDGSTLRSVSLSDGKIDFQMDYKTSDVLRVEYKFNYVSDIKSPQDKDLPDFEIHTKSTAESVERYVVNRVTQ